MAIDHRIIQQIKVKDNSQALNMFQNALNSAQSRKMQNAQNIRADQRAIQEQELMPFRRQLLEQQVQVGQQGINKAKQAADLKTAFDFAVVNKVAIENAVQSGEISGLSSLVNNSNMDDEEKQEITGMLQQGRVQEVAGGFNGAINAYQRNRGLTAGQRETSDLKRDLEGAINPETGKLKPLEELTAVQRLAAIRGGLLSSAGSTTVAERAVENKELGEGIIKFESDKEESKKNAEFRSRKRFQAGIARDIKLAEAEASAKGETLTDLKRAKAALPGIKKVVDKLSILADEATFTLAGAAWDVIAKQLFGVSTEGSTAKAKMISMVDNQVLPMLKPIFGSAFTAAEGDRLRDAMLDPDSTPESRKAQLSSFFDQMKENIAGKERELKDSTRIKDTTSFGPQTPQTDLSSLSIEELMEERRRLGGQ